MIGKVAILGAGSFGTALSTVCFRHAKEVVLWSRGNNIENALKDASIVILAIPMKALADILNMTRPYLTKDMILINVAKGIDPISLKLPCDLIDEIMDEEIANKACYLSGPSFAHEIVLDKPTAVSCASKDINFAKEIQIFLSSFHFRVYTSKDIIGVCLGGALKNVIAIASGICDGLALGRNAKAALITRGLGEMVRLGKKMGAKEQTFLGLSGMGDLMLSCHDDKSRNHHLGVLLAKGESLESAMAKIGSVVEGVNTAQSIPGLCKKYGVSMPISLAIYEVLFAYMPLTHAMNSLLSRPLNDEDFN